LFQNYDDLFLQTYYFYVQDKFWLAVEQLRSRFKTERNWIMLILVTVISSFSKLYANLKINCFGTWYYFTCCTTLPHDTTSRVARYLHVISICLIKKRRWKIINNLDMIILNILSTVLECILSFYFISLHVHYITITYHIYYTSYLLCTLFSR
jgi:hypothetical protein